MYSWGCWNYRSLLQKSPIKETIFCKRACTPDDVILNTMPNRTCNPPTAITNCLHFYRPLCQGCDPRTAIVCAVTPAAHRCWHSFTLLNLCLIQIFLHNHVANCESCRFLYIWMKLLTPTLTHTHIHTHTHRSTLDINVIPFTSNVLLLLPNPYMIPFSLHPHDMGWLRSVGSIKV